MLAIILALAAFLSWGTADIFGGLVSREIGGYSAGIWSFILGTLLASFYVPFAIPTLRHITLSTALWLLILSPPGVFSMIAFYEGLKRGNASLVGTIAGSFGALAAILSIIFFKETLNWQQTTGIILVFVGIVTASINLKELKLGNILTDKGVPYALVACLLWGFYFAFVKIPVANVGWFWPAYLSWLTFPLGLIYLKKKKIKFRTPRSKKLIAYAIINSLLLVTGVFSYNFATTKGQISIIAPIASSYPALFAILAYFVFKDRLSKQQILGIVITLFGIISLSIP